MIRDRVNKFFGQERLGRGEGEYLYVGVTALSIDYVQHLVVIKDDKGNSKTFSTIEKVDIANDLKNRISAFIAEEEGCLLKFIDPIDVLYDADTLVLWLASASAGMWSHPPEW